MTGGRHGARGGDATLRGEPLEIYPFLGAYQLAEAVDGLRGGTKCGHRAPRPLRLRERLHARPVPVSNVAQPVIRAAYAVYHLPGRMKEQSAE